jgi:hypothetical protein
MSRANSKSNSSPSAESSISVPRLRPRRFFQHVEDVQNAFFLILEPAENFGDRMKRVQDLFAAPV